MSLVLRTPRWFLQTDGTLRCYGRDPFDTGHTFALMPTADNGNLFPTADDGALFPTG